MLSREYEDRTAVSLPDGPGRRRAIVYSNLTREQNGRECTVIRVHSRPKVPASAIRIPIYGWKRISSVVTTSTGCPSIIVGR